MAKGNKDCGGGGGGGGLVLLLYSSEAVKCVVSPHIEDKSCAVLRGREGKGRREGAQARAWPGLGSGARF